MTNLTHCRAEMNLVLTTSAYVYDGSDKLTMHGAMILSASAPYWSRQTGKGTQKRARQELHIHGTCATKVAAVGQQGSVHVTCKCLIHSHVCQAHPLETAHLPQETG